MLSGQSLPIRVRCPLQPGAAAAAMDGLLDPTPALIERLAGQEGHVEGIQDRDRPEELFAAAVLNPVHLFIAATSAASRQAVGRSASQDMNAFFERPATTSSRRGAGALTDRGEIDDLW